MLYHREREPVGVHRCCFNRPGLVGSAQTASLTAALGTLPNRRLQLQERTEFLIRAGNKTSPFNAGIDAVDHSTS
jgi:hypothetical protein